MKLDHASGVVVALLGVGVISVAWTLPFTDGAMTLGSGIFPFVLGLLLLLLGLAIVGSAVFAAEPTPDVRSVFAWEMIKRPALVVGLLAFSVFLFEFAGFAISILVLLIGFLRAFSSHSWPVIVTIAVVATAAFYGLFGIILQVPISLFPSF